MKKTGFFLWLWQPFRPFWRETEKDRERKNVEDFVKKSQMDVAWNGSDPFVLINRVWDKPGSKEMLLFYFQAQAETFLDWSIFFVFCSSRSTYN